MYALTTRGKMLRKLAVGNAMGKDDPILPVGAIVQTGEVLGVGCILKN